MTSSSMSEQPKLVTRAPTVLPVVLWTLFFGIFGIISVLRRSWKARSIGAPIKQYWFAFGAVVLSQIFLVVLINSSGSTVVDNPTLTATDLATSMEEGASNSFGGNVTLVDVVCRPKKIDSYGTGTWTCTYRQLGIEGRIEAIVDATSEGAWSVMSEKPIPNS